MGSPYSRALFSSSGCMFSVCPPPPRIWDNVLDTVDSYKMILFFQLLPTSSLPVAFILNLHAQKQKKMVIINPGIWTALYLLWKAKEVRGKYKWEEVSVLSLAGTCIWPWPDLAQEREPGREWCGQTPVLRCQCSSPASFSFTPILSPLK